MKYNKLAKFLAAVPVAGLTLLSLLNEHYSVRSNLQQHTQLNNVNGGN